MRRSSRRGETSASAGRTRRRTRSCSPSGARPKPSGAGTWRGALCTSRSSRAPCARGPWCLRGSTGWCSAPGTRRRASPGRWATWSATLVSTTGSRSRAAWRRRNPRRSFGASSGPGGNPRAKLPRVKPAAFEYLAPRSVEEAVALLAERGEDAKVIAGGQSLVPMMAFRLATPAALVDLNGVSELDHGRVDRDTLVLGATARHRSVQELSGLRERCAMVAEAVDLIGHPAIRNRGTVGGSVAHADPAAEWPAILLALDGEVDAVGPNGNRTIRAADLFQTYFTTALAPDEILTEVRLPLPDGAPTGS